MSDGRVEFEIVADGKSAIESVKEVTNAIATEAQKWDKSADQATDKIGDSFSDMQRDIKQEAKHTADDVGNSFADIAKKALLQNRPVREIILEEKLLSQEEVDKILDPVSMTE